METTPTAETKIEASEDSKKVETSEDSSLLDQIIAAHEARGRDDWKEQLPMPSSLLDEALTTKTKLVFPRKVEIPKQPPQVSALSKAAPPDILSTQQLEPVQSSDEKHQLFDFEQTMDLSGFAETQREAGDISAQAPKTRPAKESPAKAPSTKAKPAMPIKPMPVKPDDKRQLFDFEQTMDLSTFTEVHHKVEAAARQQDLEETLDLLGLVVDKDTEDVQESPRLEPKKESPRLEPKKESPRLAAIRETPKTEGIFKLTDTMEIPDISEAPAQLPKEPPRRESGQETPRPSVTKAIPSEIFKLTDTMELPSTIEPPETKSPEVVSAAKAAEAPAAEAPAAEAPAAKAAETPAAKTDKGSTSRIMAAKMMSEKAIEPGSPKEVAQKLCSMSLNFIMFLEQLSSPDDELRIWHWPFKVNDPLEVTTIEEATQQQVQYLKTDEESALESWVGEITIVDPREKRGELKEKKLASKK